MANDSLNNSLEYFIGFIAEIRPKNAENTEEAIQKLRNKIDNLLNDKDAFLLFQKNCQSLLLTSNVEDLFSSSFDLYSSENLMQQLFKDIKYKILPPLEDKNSINYKIHQVFYKKDDFKWTSALPNELWLALSDISGITNVFIQEHFQKTLHNMFLILSYKIAALGLDEELSERFMINGELISPFIQQNKEVSLFIESEEHNRINNIETQHNLNHLLVMLNQCVSNIENIRKNTLTYGTSLKQSYLLNRIESNINRLKILVDIVDQKEFNQNRFIDFLKEIIYNNNHRNDIAYLLSKNVGYLAYQIAEHKGNTGDHYITNNRKEFFDFFKAAFGGGVVIAFLVLIKSLISSLPITDFWMAFLYSLNYGIGFIAIHLLGFSVATKQPAMTASALAKEIDNRKDKTSNLNGVAMLIAKVSRSQLISVAGNLTAVFPTALVIAVVYYIIAGHSFLDETHAIKYQHEIHPLYSLCWLYGAIAGFYLFLTGIVAGYFDNAVIYSKIPERIRQHPKLQTILSAEKREKLAAYLDHNFGAIISNFVIGIFLGTASFIGKTFGIPFDIRHVTFSFGIFAMSLPSTFSDMNTYTFLWILTGIASIGFFNIVTSFGMAFYIAIKSRNIGITQLIVLPKLVFVYFRKFPTDFFYPPKVDRNEEEVFAEPV